MCGAVSSAAGVFMAFPATAAQLPLRSRMISMRWSSKTNWRLISCAFNAAKSKKRGIRPGRVVHPPGHAIDRIGAKRVVLDTISPFSELEHRRPALGLQRLFGWLKKGVTAIITGERGERA